MMEQQPPRRAVQWSITTDRRRWSSWTCRTTSPTPRAASTSARASGSCRWPTASSGGRWQPTPWSPTPRTGILPRRHTSSRAAGSGPSTASQYTWGAQLHPELQVAGEVVRKGQGGEDGCSGFTVRDPVTGEEAATPLEELLRRHGVRRVVVVGLATDYCVKETALDAVRLRFDTVVLAGWCGRSTCSRVTASGRLRRCAQPGRASSSQRSGSLVWASRAPVGWTWPAAMASYRPVVGGIGRGWSRELPLRSTRAVRPRP
jgi:nicotinamidase-related amidase